MQETGPLTEKAVVLHVMDASFDVLIIKYGVVKRVYTNVSYLFYGGADKPLKASGFEQW